MEKKQQQTKKKTIHIPLLGDMTVSLGRTVLGIAMGLVASAVLILISGVNPLTAYASLIKGAIGSKSAICNVLVRSSPLLLGGIGVALGIKSGVWNTGIEGYMYLGALGAAVVGVLDLGIPSWLHILLCFIAAMVCSGLWGAIPGYLRAYQGVNEVTSTIMLNYVAIYLTNWAVSNFTLIADKDAFYPMSVPFNSTALLPQLVRGTSLHPGPFIAIILCVIFHFLLNYTPFGFRTKMLGSNPFAARYAGVDSKKQLMIIMIIGAVIGGLSGAIEVMGLKRRVYMEFVTGVGYESVAVALLAGGNPLGVIASALFFAALKAGGTSMSTETGLSSDMNSIIIALCMLFVIGVGVVDARRSKKIVSNDKDEDTAASSPEENAASKEAK